MFATVVTQSMKKWGAGGGEKKDTQMLIQGHKNQQLQDSEPSRAATTPHLTRLMKR